MTAKVVQNIFRPEATVTMTASVKQRLGSGKYEVEDISGRLTVVAADSSRLWPVGVSVVVQNGRIIGAGHRMGKHRVVDV